MELLFTISPTAYLVSVVTLLVVATLYLFWDEHQLRRTLRHLKPEHHIAYLLRRFRLRNITLLLLLTMACSGLLLLVEMFRKEMGLLADPSTPIEIVEIQDPNAMPDPAGTAAPTASNAAKPVDKPKKPSKTSKKPENMGEKSAKTELSAPIEPETTVILDLFTSDAELTSDQSLDAIKKRYENALTGAYMLSHCERTNKEEMKILLAALRDDIVDYQSQTGNSDLNPQELYEKIVSAAEGSYQMIYAKTPCDAPEITALEHQYASFVARYKAKQEALKHSSKKAKVSSERERKKPASPSGATP